MLPKVREDPTLPPYLSIENLPPAAGEDGREGRKFLIIKMMMMIDDDNYDDDDNDDDYDSDDVNDDQ